MITTCTDACCFNNLIHGEIATLVLASAGRKLCIEGLVYDEVISNRDEIDKLLSEGKVQSFSGDEVRASEVGAIAERYNIGVGEAECIAIGIKTGGNVASDDLRARRAALRELGQSRVIGSLGLLREAVTRGSLTADAAFNSYRLMVDRGGYLPRIENANFFTKAI